MNLKNKHMLNVSAVLLLLLGSCSQAQISSSRSTPTAQPKEWAVSKSDHVSCFQAARKLLGPEVTLLKCGRLSDAIDLEAVAGIRVPNLKDGEEGIPVSRLVIARYGIPAWKIELNVDANGEITNGVGYVGIDFIDDSNQFPYYRVNFTDRGANWGSRTAAQFTLVLSSMSRDGRIDPGDIGIGIGWNSAVGRFQEIEPTGDKFAPEVKAPKHIKSNVKP
jgi:hypothetical protein